MHLGPIDLDGRELAWDRQADLDLARSDCVRLEAQHALDERSDGSGMALRRALAREIEQVLDDASCSLGFLRKKVGILAHVFGESFVAADPLRVADYRRQRVVQLVRNARHELTHRLHLLGLEQLRLEPLDGREVTNEHETARFTRDRDSRDRDLGREGCSVGSNAGRPEARMTAPTCRVAATRSRVWTGHAQLVRTAAKQLLAGRAELGESGAVRVQDLPSAADQQ